MEKRIAIVFSDVIREIYKMRGGKVVNSNIQFRIEKDEKQRSSQILETMGLSLPAYLRICMIRLNKEKGIPFSMKLDDRIPEEGTGIELPS